MVVLFTFFTILALVSLVTNVSAGDIGGGLTFVLPDFAVLSAHSPSSALAWN